MSCPRTQRNDPGQGSNPGRSTRRLSSIPLFHVVDQFTVRQYCCLVLHFTDTSSAADMKCKISSSCSSCQQTDSKTVNPDSNITDNCSISTRKQALGMTWKQAKQEVQSTAVSPDLVLLHSNSTKDGHSASCECTAVYLRRKCFLIQLGPHY